MKFGFPIVWTGKFAHCYFPKGNDVPTQDNWYEVEVMKAEDAWDMVSKSVFSYVHKFLGSLQNSSTASLTRLISFQDAEEARKPNECLLVKTWRTAYIPGKRLNRPWPRLAFRNHASVSG